MTALERVAAERKRQEQLFADGELVWIASRPDCPDELRLAALVEEVGEVARAYHDGGDIRTELVQVAAVAVAWLDGLQTTEGMKASAP